MLIYQNVHFEIIENNFSVHKLLEEDYTESFFNSTIYVESADLPGYWLAPHVINKTTNVMVYSFETGRHCIGMSEEPYSIQPLKDPSLTQDDLTE